MKREPAKLPMTNEEIRREYLEAKDRKAQIRILADENLCSVYMIKKILEEEGVYKIKRCYARGEENDLGGETITTDPPIIVTEEPIYDVKEPQTRAGETIEEAVTLDAEEAEWLKCAGGEFKKFMDTRLNMTVCTLELNENAALAVAAMVTYCLKRCDAKIEQINASLEEIAKRKRDQELVRDTLLSIKERLPKFEKFNFEKSNLFDEEGE